MDHYASVRKYKHYSYFESDSNLQLRACVTPMGQVRAFRQKMRAYNSVKGFFVSVFLLVRLPLRLFSLCNLQCYFGGYIGAHVRVTRDGAGIGPC